MLNTQVQASQWGPDDQRGAANELTPAVILSAIGLVKQGQVFDLSQPTSVNSPRIPEAQFPYVLSMRSHPSVNRLWYERVHGATNGIGFAEERVEMELHTGTHVDSLGHCCMGDHMFNQRAVQDIAGNSGLQELGIENLPPVVTRGVLIDIPLYRGEELTGGEVITPEDLEGALKQQGSHLLPGDIALIRTGWWRYYEQDNDRYLSSAPGIGLAAAQWLAGHRVVAIGSDTMVLEVYPDESPTAPHPVHQYLLVQAGIYIIENAYLEDLAGAGVYESLCLCLAPKFRGATGSPIRLAAIV